MKRFANISVVSLALVALLAGAALAESPGFYDDDESGYQDQAASFKALLLDNDTPARNTGLQNKIDLRMARSFSEVQITPAICSEEEKAQFQTLMARTDVITNELGYE